MAPRSEWSGVDYYRTLGVAKDAGATEITRAYRKLAKLYHPDMNPGKEEQFKAVAIAYEVLSDTALRKEYDEFRALRGSSDSRDSGNSGNSNGAGGNGSNNTASRRDENLSDLIGEVFNRKRKPPSAREPVRGENIEAEVRISFEDAANGKNITLNIDSDVICDDCHGTGSADGVAPIVCRTCKGTGSITENQGFFAMSVPCPDCAGHGERRGKPCRSCSGAGVEHSNRQVTLKVPPGIGNGAKIRVKGGGGAGRYGGPAGDLYVTARVEPHRFLTPRGADLLLAAPITFAEAVLGATIKVPGLSGPVSVNVPAGVRSGLELRVKGQGLPKRGKKGRGDLLVVIEIDVPETATAEQKSAVEAFARVTTNPRKHWDE